MAERHESFMQIALEEAALARGAGNMAVGAVIVRDGRCVSRGHNQVESTFDVSAHAETVAVRRLTIAERRLNPGSQADSGPFAGATLYTTVEPCPMCAWIACISGLSSIVLGARHAELGISLGQYTIEKLVAMTERKIRIVTGVLSAECAAMCRTSPNFREGPR